MLKQVNPIYDGGGKTSLNHWFLPLCGGDYCG